MVISTTATAGRDLASGDGRASLDSLFPLALARRIGNQLRRRRDYRRLAELPDYLLQDIGVTRAQVHAELRRRLF